MGKRITIICGHYGSGKTEVSVNYAIHAAAISAISKEYERTALIDLDIANPYFRSRELRQMLTSKGVDVYSDVFGYDTTSDLPAVTANVRAPLESKDTLTIVDVGGDAAGARILNQFRKYFLPDETDVICVVNANRPETGTIQGVESHIAEIQAETGLRINGIINNTHLLRETTCEIVLDGIIFVQKVAEELQIPIKFHTCNENLLTEVLEKLGNEGLNAKLEGERLSANLEREGLNTKLFPMTLYMRPTWLDK